jgi:hypothetical protein
MHHYHTTTDYLEACGAQPNTAKCRKKSVLPKGRQISQLATLCLGGGGVSSNVMVPKFISFRYPELDHSHIPKKKKVKKK